MNKITGRASKERLSSIEIALLQGKRIALTANCNMEADRLIKCRITNTPQRRSGNVWQRDRISGHGTYGRCSPDLVHVCISMYCLRIATSMLMGVFSPSYSGVTHRSLQCERAPIVRDEQNPLSLYYAAKRRIHIFDRESPVHPILPNPSNNPYTTGYAST